MARAPQTPLGALARGAVAGAVGIAAMDLVQFARYRRGGGNDRLLAWEFSAGLKDWEQAPAPAQLGKRIVEGAVQRQLPPERAALFNNLMHWVTGSPGVGCSGWWGLAARSQDPPWAGPAMGWS
jgi:hypothetical protein